MTLYNIWVSLSEMSDKNIDLFMILYIFLDVPVCHFQRNERILNLASSNIQISVVEMCANYI